MLILCFTKTFTQKTMNLSETYFDDLQDKDNAIQLLNQNINQGKENSCRQILNHKML